LRFLIFFFLTAGVALVPATPPEKPVWPQFRGPDANPVGTDPGLPERWSKTESVEWSAEIPGLGWSSPIVTGNKVLLTTAITEGKMKPPQIGTEYSNEYFAKLMDQGLSEEEAGRRVLARDLEMPDEVALRYVLYCLELKTGNILWKRKVYAGWPPGGRHRKNSFASETPVTDGERVYVYFGNLGLYAYDLDGNRIWATPLEAHKMSLDFGTGSSPVLHGDLVIILHDNQDQQFLAAFDKKTGKLVWRTNRDVSQAKVLDRRSGWTTPFVWSNGVRTEIVAVGPGVAVSYDLDGKELWRISGMSLLPVPSPFAYDGLLYLDTGVHGDDYRPLAAIRPGATGDISLGESETTNDFVVWYQRIAGTYIPTPVGYQGSIYVLYDKGIFARFDAKTGERLYRSRIAPGAGAFTASPWAYNGKIFCLSEEGDTFVIAAGDEFKMLGVNSLEEMALATPAIVGDRLLIRTMTRLYSIREKEG
jgi:outer membrane protein assembly factor BamB